MKYYKLDFLCKNFRSNHLIGQFHTLEKIFNYYKYTNLSHNTTGDLGEMSRVSLGLT